MRRFALLLMFLAAACGGSAPSRSTAPTPPPAPAPLAVAAVPLTAATLKQFVAERFPAAVTAGTVTLDFGDGHAEDDLLTELAACGFDNVAQLAAIIPADYPTKGIAAVAASSAPTTSIPGLVRDLLIIHDVRGYFTKAWNHGWMTTGPQDFPAPAAYGVDFNVMVELGVFSWDGSAAPAEDAVP